MIRLFVALALVAPAMAAEPAAIPGQGQGQGQAVFAARCASCHAAVAGAAPGAGPNLAGVVGRRVGGDPGFDYSPVLEAAREAGQAWDAPTLERFLADPEEMFPGLWMGAYGLRDPAARAAVAAWLQDRQ